MALGDRMRAEEIRDAIILEPADMPEQDVSDDAEVFENFRNSAESERAGLVLGVYRIPTDAKNNPTGEESRHLFNAPIDRYDLDQLYSRIKKEYMPRGFGVGTFRLMVRRIGQRGVMWKKLIVLEKGAMDDDPLPQEPNAGNKNDPAIGALAEAMQRQNELLGRIFERQASGQLMPQTDPLAQTERMMTMITGIAGILVQRPVQSGGGGDLGGMIGGMREMMKFAREVGSGGDIVGESESELTGVLKAAAPFADLLKVVLQRAPNPPAAQPRMIRRALAGPQNAPNAPTQPTAPATPDPIITAPGAPFAFRDNQPVAPEDPMILKLREQIGQFCTLLETAPDTDPDAVASLILDMIPAEHDEKFYALVSDENWLNKLAVFDRRVLKHAEFFGKVRAKILTEFQSEENEAPADPPTVF